MVRVNLLETCFFGFKLLLGLVLLLLIPLSSFSWFSWLSESFSRIFYTSLVILLSKFSRPYPSPFCYQPMLWLHFSALFLSHWVCLSVYSRASVTYVPLEHPFLSFRNIQQHSSQLYISSLICTVRIFFIIGKCYITMPKRCLYYYV